MKRQIACLEIVISLSTSPAIFESFVNVLAPVALKPVRPYVSVNGVKAEGGSIGGPGRVIVGGMLYVNSGYDASRGFAGNVLLAFSIDGK